MLKGIILGGIIGKKIKKYAEELAKQCDSITQGHEWTDLLDDLWRSRREDYNLILPFKIVEMENIIQPLQKKRIVEQSESFQAAIKATLNAVMGTPARFVLLQKRPGIMAPFIKKMGQLADRLVGNTNLPIQFMNINNVFETAPFLELVSNTYGRDLEMYLIGYIQDVG